MKTTKRLLAVLLALVLICTSMPLVFVEAATTVDSGTCGENLTWTLDSDGTLTISGTGKMKDYTWCDVSPFYYKNIIKTVNIYDGVTSIGNYGFSGCSNLMSVTIPDSVMRIGYNAFCNCSSLTSVIIGSEVNDIDSVNSVFEGCSKLETIVVSSANTYYSSSDGILYNKDKSQMLFCPYAKTELVVPDSVYYVSRNALSHHHSLRTLTLGRNIEVLEGSMQYGRNDYAFDSIFDCPSLQKIIVDPKNERYASDEDGVLYSKDYSVLFRYPQALQKTDYTVRNSVTAIHEHAFNSCSNLKHVIISDSVTRIGAGAFFNCESLESVEIPNSVTQFDDCSGEGRLTGAFEECTSLKHITIPDSVTKINWLMFGNCSSLTSVSIPESIKSVDIKAFYGCENLKDVFYASSPENWAAIRVDEENDPLRNVTIHYNSEHEHIAGELVHENEQLATCTVAASYEAVTYCTVCGEELSRETVFEGDPLGHLEQTYTTPSTCAENGFSITICTRCGETLSKEILPRLDHNWTSEVTQNPTCTAQGVKTYTCADCGETYTEPVDVLAHQWDDGKMTKEPSCTETGEMTYTCATGGETRTEPIDKLDHEIVLVAGKAASCTEPGLTDGWQCKNCKKWFAEQQTISALNHDPQIGAIVEPTCTEPGYTPFICTRCGETVSKTDPTDALGHNMQPTYVWAKDDSTVTATMVCTRCDKTGMTETAEVKTEITVKPTCSTEGELTLIAAFNNKSFYGQTKTKTLPRDPNAHVFKVTVTQPTCLDDGYTTHACTLCRYGYSDEIVSALGHDYQNHDAKAPTCEAPGWDAYDTCSRCDYTTYSELATVDHDDADNDGKCDMCGEQMRGGNHCKYCGKIHGGAFGWLTKLIHSILAVFKR